MDKISTDVQDDYDLPALPILPIDSAESPKKMKRTTAATQKSGARATQKAGARALGLDSDTDTEVSWVKSSPHGFKKMTAAESRCVLHMPFEDKANMTYISKCRPGTQQLPQIHPLRHHTRFSFAYSPLARFRFQSIHRSNSKHLNLNVNPQTFNNVFHQCTVTGLAHSKPFRQAYCDWP
jgi:hypothetical protein